VAAGALAYCLLLYPVQQGLLLLLLLLLRHPVLLLLLWCFVLLPLLGRASTPHIPQ
jgi:hypothetical protein